MLMNTAMPIPSTNFALDYNAMKSDSTMNMSNCLDSSLLYDSQVQLNRIQANVMRELQVLISLNNTKDPKKDDSDSVKKPRFQNSDIQPLTIKSMNVRELVDDTLVQTPISHAEGMKKREQYHKRRFEATLSSSDKSSHRATTRGQNAVQTLKSMDSRNGLSQQAPSQVNELQSCDVKAPISNEGTQKSQQYLEERFEASLGSSSSERTTEICDGNSQEISPRKRRKYGRRNSVTAEMIMATWSSANCTKDV